MKYNPAIHHRRSIRLKGYDYSRAGLYFITICAQNRLHLFGEIENEKMRLNDAGNMIAQQWRKLTQRFEKIKLQESIVMPNHFHAIIQIAGIPLVGTQTVGTKTNTDNNNIKPGIQIIANKTANTQTTKQSKWQKQEKTASGKNGKIILGQPQGIAPTVGDVVGVFKSLTTNEYIRNVKQNNWKSFDKKIWQRNYYEHIIRDEKSYLTISEYIINNPLNWQNDKYYA